MGISARRMLQAIAERLLQIRTIGGHLRGHAQRFLAQCQAMSGLKTRADTIEPEDDAKDASYRA